MHARQEKLKYYATWDEHISSINLKPDSTDLSFLAFVDVIFLPISMFQSCFMSLAWHSLAENWNREWFAMLYGCLWLYVCSRVCLSLAFPDPWFLSLSSVVLNKLFTLLGSVALGTLIHLCPCLLALFILSRPSPHFRFNFAVKFRTEFFYVPSVLFSPGVSSGCDLWFEVRNTNDKNTRHIVAHSLCRYKKIIQFWCAVMHIACVQ